jgi:hypothetical protein
MVARLASTPGWKIGAGDFLEGKKAVSFRTVVDKRGLEAGLDAGDDGFVDIALFLFLGGRFNVQVNEFLTINNGNTEFLGLCRVKKHAFHEMGSRALSRGSALCRQRRISCGWECFMGFPEVQLIGDISLTRISRRALKVKDSGICLGRSTGARRAQFK